MTTQAEIMQNNLNQWGNLWLSHDLQNLSKHSNLYCIGKWKHSKTAIYVGHWPNLKQKKWESENALCPHISRGVNSARPLAVWPQRRARSFRMPGSAVTLLLFGSTSSKLSFEFWMLWDKIWELLFHSFVHFFADVISRTSLFLSSWPLSSLMSRSSQKAQSQHFHSELFLLRFHLNSIWMLLLALSFFVSLSCFHFCWPSPYFNSPLLYSGTWVYHWDQEAPQHTLCCAVGTG